MSSVNNLEVQVQVQPEVQPQPQPQTQPLKKYRRSSYDKHDTKYAETLYKIYITLNTEVKMLFDEFTDNLMDETHINRYSLLDAICDFENCDKYKPDSLGWNLFSDTAFNCRPYQPW